MMNEHRPIYSEWSLTYVSISTGEVVYHEKGENVVTVNGRVLSLQNIFGISASSAIALAAGPCSTAATVNDTRLNYEFIANGSRKTLTDQALNPLSTSDFVQQTFTDQLGNTYYAAVTVRGTFTGNTDANQGQPFQEFGLTNTTRTPSTPTGTSGILLNHYVAAASQVLTSDIVLYVDTTIRL